MPSSNNFPQLRVRTGFSFRHAYGRIPEVIEHLKAIGSNSAAIVDFNTWGHAKFEKAAQKAGIVPMYGCEIPIVTMDEAGEPKAAKPLAWVLAKDTKALYNLTTLSFKTKGLTRDVFGVQPAYMQRGGLIKFPGGAIDSLHYGDYDFIDINPSSFLLAARGVHHHRMSGIPLVITSYNDMPSLAHRSNAYSWEVRESVGMRHIATVEEIWSQLQNVMTRKEFDSGIENAFMIQNLLKYTKLQRAPIINVEGDLSALCEVGRKSRLKRGHIEKWTKEYKDRLAEELKQIKAKGFDSYFIVVADLIQFAKQHMLVGPARGSSAGSLVCYLIGITEVDPIPHKLLFQRFIDVSRSDWPDIDIDFSDSKRFMVFDYLKEKYGVDHVSKLGSVSTLQPRSIMPQVGKKFRIPIDDNFQVVNALIEYPQGDPRYGHALEDTFEKTPQGQTFKKCYPAAAACMVGIELHESHSGVHAAGIIVCNDPVSDYCTVNDEGIPQIDKVDAEQLNLLKIDALGLRTLGIIEDANVVTAEELYSLKLDDPEVLKILTDDKVSGVFQFEGSALRGVTKQMNAVDEFNKIVNLTALARPGPLGSNMATTYINRSNGKSAVKYDVPQLEPFLKDTFGVIVYQEQLMAILREVGRFDWAKTSEVRKGMSKSKGEEYLNQWRGDFVKGAMENGVPEPKAENLWKEMATFGAYGFNQCISGDTKVLLAYSNQSVGKNPTIEQLYKMYVSNPSKSLKQKMNRKKCMPVLLCLNEEDGNAYPVMAENIYFNGPKPCIKLKFSDGSEIICTKDHKFIIDGDWKPCGFAKVGSLFTSISNSNGKSESKARALIPGSKGWANGMSWSNGKRMELNGKSRYETQFKKDSADKPCEDCGSKDSPMEAHHNDFSAGTIRPSDLSWLCSSCHKKKHFSNGDRKKAYEKGQSIGAPLVLVGIEDAGEVDTYDIGMPDPWHNFELSNGLITHNSHSVSYAIVTYWTCYLKRYHKLEFAAACLRSAKDHEQTIAILRELAKEGVSYTAIDPAFSDMNWKVADGRLIGGIMNAKGYGPAKAMKYIQNREKLSTGPLPKKEHKAIMKSMESLANAEVQYADLSEAHTKWGHLYKNPRLVGVTNGDKIIGMNDAKDGQKGDVLIIAKIVKKEILDENDSARIKKRHGRRYEGPSQILDMWMVDDSTDNAVRFRVRPERFEELAKEVVERAPVNSWFLMRAWKIPEISMFIVKKLKWLDKPPEERKDGPLIEMQG